MTQSNNGSAKAAAAIAPLFKKLDIRPRETYQRDPAKNNVVVRIDSMPDGVGLVSVCDAGDLKGKTQRFVRLDSLRNVTPDQVRTARIAEGKYVEKNWRSYDLRGGILFDLREIFSGEFALTLTHPKTSLSGISIKQVFKGAGTRPAYVRNGEAPRMESFYSFGLILGNLPADPTWKHDAPITRFLVSGGVTLYAKEFEPGQWAVTLTHPDTKVDLTKVDVDVKVMGSGLRPVPNQQRGDSSQARECYSRMNLTITGLPADKKPAVDVDDEDQDPNPEATAALLAKE